MTGVEMTFPNEIWLQILGYLDLSTQYLISSVSKELSVMIRAVWRLKLVRLASHLELNSGDKFQSARLKLVMSSLIAEQSEFVAKMENKTLYKLLHTHRTLLDDSATKGEEYDFFHDYNKTGLKWLDLRQKWPRPGNKSLNRFSESNPSLVFLSVTDCRENIESVHHLISHCLQLQGLRLLATDPLLPYTEILKLKSLRYLEVQFDSFYRDHREEFIYKLGQLPHLQVLKLLTCYGLNDQQVISLISSCSSSLICLHLPFNSRIEGWFLEDLVGNTELTKHLVSLHVTINTAYTDLTTSLPVLHANNLQERLAKENDLSVEVVFVNKKLSSFNPKEFQI